jgi:hypothetical protein
VELALAPAQGTRQLGYALGPEEQQDYAQHDDQFRSPYLGQSRDHVRLLSVIRRFGWTT